MEKDFFNDETKKQISKAIKTGNYEEILRICDIYGASDYENLDEELQGKAYFSLAQIFSHNKRTNNLEQEIIDYFDIKKDINAAIVCYWKSATLKNEKALGRLFNIYFFPEEGVQDYEKAMQVANYGITNFNDAYCYFKLGTMYYQGFGVKKNYVKARELFEKSAEQLPNLGGYELGVMYENGSGGVEVDYEKAFYYYLDAADFGDELAAFKCGAIYSGFYGKTKFADVEPSPYLAKAYFNDYLTKSKEHRRDHATFAVGRMEFENGEQKERVDGIKKIIRTAKRGEKDAKKYLKENTEFGDITEEKPVDLSFLK